MQGNNNQPPLDPFMQKVVLAAQIAQSQGKATYLVTETCPNGCCMDIKLGHARGEKITVPEILNALMSLQKIILEDKMKGNHHHEWERKTEPAQPGPGGPPTNLTPPSGRPGYFEG